MGILLIRGLSSCLLGIFGVHIPLIYGEGGVEAFIRLQRAIMEQSDDQSLFAWKQEQGPAAHGLLATSPAYFANSSHIVRMQKSMSHRPAYRMTNRGLEIQLYITCGLLGGDHNALLDCADSETLDTVGVYVTPMRDGRFLRINLDKLTILTQSPLNKRYKKSTLETLHIPQLYLSEKPTPKLIKFVVRDSVFNYKRHPEPNRLIKSLNYALPSSLSLIQTGTAPVTFTPMVTTEAGRKGRGENFNTVEFTLQVGGRGGVLFVPCGTGTFSPHVTRSRPSSSILRHVAVIIGVNLDESVYAEILTFRHCDGMPYNAESSRFLPWAQSIPQSIRLDQVGSIDWFGNYVMQASVDSSGRKSEVEVRDLEFCANVVQLTIPRSSNEVDYYDVFVSYSPKS